MKKRIPLEPAALQVCIENSVPPLVFQLPPEEGRLRLDEAQNSPVYKYPAQISVMDFGTEKWGNLNVYLVKPENYGETPNVIFYIHGAGWVYGNFHTHEKLVRELSARTNSVLVFLEYSLSPESKYPIAIEQCYEVMTSLPAIGKKCGLTLNMATLTVAGDSVGGNMATAMTIMSKYRNGPQIQKQLLYYPVTNSFFNTNSYLEFATGYSLYREGMIWFWDQYTQHQIDRSRITVSPLRASLEQLAELPDTMIINGEADVLRDDGEGYAARLMQAGVNVTAVRVKATIHDFVMLNALDQTNACRAAMDVSTSWINRLNCNAR